MSRYRDDKAGIYINSLGFRGKEFKKEKEKGIFRIIALGDSCTFGVGAEGTTYPEILEKKLNTSNIKYQVINAGVPAYTSSQAFLYLRNELINYKPDLILVYIGWNNIWTYKNPGANTAHSPLVRKISRTLSKSLSFALLRNYIINPTRGNPKFSKKEIAKKDSTEGLFKQKIIIFKEDISKMIRLAKMSNSRIILLTLPTVIRKEMREKDMLKFTLAITWTEGYEIFLEMQVKFNEAIKEIGNNENIEVVDLDYFFDNLQLDEVKGLFKDAIHPNENGLSFIAQHLSQKILN